MSEIEKKLDRFFLLGWMEDSGTYEEHHKKETKQLRKEFKSALKLQELVKERIKENINHPHYGEYHDKENICLRCSVLELQSLVEQSEK